MRWNTIRWVLILAILAILMYLFIKSVTKQQEGATTFNSVPMGLKDIQSVLPEFPNIKKNAIIKLAGEGYDLTTLSDSYNTVKTDIIKSITTYNQTMSELESGRNSDFVYKFATTFVKNDNDIQLNFEFDSINAGVIRSPFKLGNTTLVGSDPNNGNNKINIFKDYFGGVVLNDDKITLIKILPSKSGNIDCIENSTDMKISDFSVFGLLNYYFLKLYVITEWYMFYINAPTVSVSNLKSDSSDKLTTEMAELERQLADAAAAQDAQHTKWLDAYNNSCGNKDECPGRYRYEKEQKSNLDVATGKRNAIDTQIADLKKKIEEQGKTDAADTKTLQEKAVVDYATLRAKVLSSLPGLIPAILKDISGNMMVINKIKIGIQKLTESYIASCKANKTRENVIKALKNTNSAEDIIKNTIPGFLDKNNKFDIAQIEDFDGDITKNIDKMHILNAFNSAYPKRNTSSIITDEDEAEPNNQDQSGPAPEVKPPTPTPEAELVSINESIKSMIENANVNIEYLTDPYVKSEILFREMDKYTLTYKNCNAFNYILDVYYRETDMASQIFDYFIDKYFRNGKTDSNDIENRQNLKLCNILVNSSSKSPSPDLCNPPANYDNMYTYLVIIERNLFDLKKKEPVLKKLENLEEDTVNKITEFATVYINRLMNIRNFTFMLYVRISMMFKYITDNLIYTNVNVNGSLDGSMPTGRPIDSGLYQIGDYVEFMRKSRIFSDAKTYYEIERYIYYLSEISLYKIYRDLDLQYTKKYIVNPKKIVNLSQGNDIYNNALQYLSYIESSNKYTNNMENIYKSIYSSFNNNKKYSIIRPTNDNNGNPIISTFFYSMNVVEYIVQDIEYCNNAFSSIEPKYLTSFLDEFDAVKYRKMNTKMDIKTENDVVKTIPIPNLSLVQTCRDVRDKLKNYLYLPTYFSNGYLNGCFKDETRGKVFNDNNSFKIGVVSKLTGSKKDPKQDKYGAIVNCINDTVAYNNVNNTNYDTVTLKPYGTSNDAYYCYAANKNDTIYSSSPGTSQLIKESDVSKCYIDKNENVANTTISYSVNPLQFDPKTDKLVSKGCYATSDIPNKIYNTLPHQVGGDLSTLLLYNRSDPNAAAKECQRLVAEQNTKYKKDYNIYGLTTDPNDTQRLYCFAGNTKFDATHALDPRLARSYYTKGCNVEYPGPGNYMIFQDTVVSDNSCKTDSQIKLEKYADIKTKWLNTNIKNQTDGLKMVSNMIDEIDKRFPIKFEISSINLVKNGSAQAPKLEVDRTSSSPGVSTRNPGTVPEDLGLNKIKLNIWLAQGLKGDIGEIGNQGRNGNTGKIGDVGLPGHQGYHGST